MKKLLLILAMGLTPTATLASERMAATNYYVTETKTWPTAEGAGYWMVEFTGISQVTKGPLDTAAIECNGAGFWGAEGRFRHRHMCARNRRRHLCDALGNRSGRQGEQLEDSERNREIRRPHRTGHGNDPGNCPATGASANWKAKLSFRTEASARGNLRSCSRAVKRADPPSASPSPIARGVPRTRRDWRRRPPSARTPPARRWDLQRNPRRQFPAPSGQPRRFRRHAAQRTAQRRSRSPGGGGLGRRPSWT